MTLALLLHVLVVVVFGNTPGGTAQPGQGVWGAINIRLAGGDPAGRDNTTVTSDAYSGPEGAATERRWGGAVRAPQDLPSAHAQPGAAELGTWQPQAGELAPAGRLDAPAPALPEPAPTPPSALALREPAPTPPAALVEARAVVPPLELPLPAPTPTPTPAVPPPLRPLPPMPRPAALPLASDRPPTVTGDVALPMPALPPPAPLPEPPRRAVPMPAAPPALAPLAAPTLAEPVHAATAALAPMLPGPVAADSPMPTRPASPVPAPAPAPAPAVPTEPPRVAPTLAIPTPLAPMAPAALQAPVDARAVTLRDLPALPAPGPPNPQAGAAPPTPLAPRSNAVTGDVRAVPAAPGAGAAARPAAPGPDVGAPNQGARVGHDLATAPSLPASAPKLNLELVRPRGGLISPQGSRGLLPTVPHPPEAKSKLGDEIQKAGKVDCRKAYADMGVAAAAPLLLDALRDKGCRW